TGARIDFSCAFIREAQWYVDCTRYGGGIAMLAIRHILFPVDFSERSSGAAPFVGAMASRFGSKVTLISVAPPFPYAGMGGPAGAVVIDPDAVKSDLQAELDSVFV